MKDWQKEVNLYSKDDLNYIFEINKNSKIKEKISNNHKVLIIDGIYKRPELVQKYLLKSNFHNEDQMRKNKKTNLVGFRSFTRVPKNIEIINFLRNLLVEKFGVDDNDIDKNSFRRFIFNLYGYFDSIKNIKSNYHPHFDQAFAATIFLNPNEECRGGTAFYRNKIHDVHDLNDISALSSLVNIDPFDWFREMMMNEVSISSIEDNVIIGSDDRWELLEIIPMKYNRMILYNGMRFHNPYIESEWFRDYYRISQQFFFTIHTNEAYKNNKLF
tara:strand:+ start:252 stop:1067 length:816 start_codon:yes stop_codon:yes gene_type:complete